MARLALPIALVLAATVACAPSGSRELHEVYLHGVEDARLDYLYGSADGVDLPDGRVELGETVSPPVEDAPFAAEGARRVDGEPYLHSPVDGSGEPPLEAARVPLTTDMRLRTRAPLEAALYFDGERWFTLAEDVAAGRNMDVTPRLRTGGLRGVGELTAREADAIAGALEDRGGALAVGVLRREDLPERPTTGLDEHLRTGLYVQAGVATDPDAYRPPPEERIWEVVAEGDTAGEVGEDRFVLIDERADMVTVWNRVHASALNVPALPDANFERETLVAILLSERPTGGYGIEPVAVQEEGGELYVDVRLTEPDEDALVTQQITRPWLVLRILRGGFDLAWIRSADDGSLLGVARSDDTLP